MKTDIRPLRQGFVSACLAVIAVSTLAAKAAKAETSTPPAATSGSVPAAASSAGATSSASTSAPAPNSTSSISSAPAAPKGDTGSAASIDNFIPGSEVMPPAQSSPDDFIKKQKPSMDLALLLHKNREYKQALLVLEKLPPTEKTRYYTGLCYKSLGNQKAATTQFAWVAYYAKDPQLKSYAFAAIRAMKPVKPTKVGGGYCTSSKYTSAEAKMRSEEITARIAGEQRSRAERGENGSNWTSGQ